MAGTIITLCCPKFAHAQHTRMPHAPGLSFAKENLKNSQRSYWPPWSCWLRGRMRIRWARAMLAHAVCSLMCFLCSQDGFTFWILTNTVEAVADLGQVFYNADFLEPACHVFDQVRYFSLLGRSDTNPSPVPHPQRNPQMEYLIGLFKRKGGHSYQSIESKCQQRITQPKYLLSVP